MQPSSSRVGPSFAALAVGCAFLIAAPPAFASAPVDAYESFRGAALHTWEAGPIAPRLRAGAQRDGELVTPRSTRPSFVLRRLSGAHTVDLRFSFQRRGGGPQVVATLVRNRLRLRIARNGSVLVCAARGRCRRLGHAGRGRGRWHRVALALDRAGGTVRAGLDAGKRVRLAREWRAEHEVRVGDLGRERGGPIAFDDLRVTASPAAPVAAPPASAPSVAVPAAVGLLRFFAADSVWNAPLADNAPLDPQSAAITGAFRAEIARQVAARTGPWIQTTDHSTPIYTVPAEQARVRVQLDSALSHATTLQQAFASVPLPAGARPAAGSDGHLTLYQPATDSLWEFWRLRRLADGWHAAWGGAIRGVSTSPGYYRADSWPGAGSHWGATATSLPLVAGTMLMSELQTGRIEHALAISVPDARAGVFAFPAQRTDGTLTAATAIPEGARLRLDPRLNVASLRLPPMVHAMAVAAQRYGMIVRDKTNNATGFFAEDPTPGGVNPYPSLYGGQYANELLARFPWDHVQLLRMQLTTR